MLKLYKIDQCFIMSLLLYRVISMVNYLLRPLTAAEAICFE